MSFLDDKCVMFDNEDENKLEFTAVHNVTKSTYLILLGFQKAS